MTKYEIQSMLQSGPAPTRLKETKQICKTMLDQQMSLNLIPEERTTFWQFLSGVMRYTGLRLWLTQGIVLLFICSGVLSTNHTPYSISIFIPLLILASLPSFYLSRSCGMCEIEASTRASGAQIMIAKLILAGAAQIICLTVICALAITTAQYPVSLIQIILYAVVPFLACMILTLWSIRTREQHAVQSSVISCLAVSAFAGILAHCFPSVYDISAIGFWIITFVLFSEFFAKELFSLIKAWKEGKMYGVIA